MILSNACEFIKVGIFLMFSESVNLAFFLLWLLHLRRNHQRRRLDIRLYWGFQVNRLISSSALAWAASNNFINAIWSLLLIWHRPWSGDCLLSLHLHFSVSQEHSLIDLLVSLSHTMTCNALRVTHIHWVKHIIFIIRNYSFKHLHLS